jgi:hypothetical protein
MRGPDAEDDGRAQRGASGSILYRIGVNLGDVLTLETLRKRGGAHMPGFTPARTRYQLAGKLAMKPRTMPICIMNQ